MKVLFFYYGLVGGGAERVLALVGNRLVDRGFEVTIVTNPVEPVYQLDERVKLEHYGFENKRRLQYRIALIQSMRRKLKEHRPDVAVGVSDFYATYLRIASIGLGIKIVASDHCAFKRTPNIGGADLSPQAKFMQYCVYPFMDKVFVLTNQDKNDAWYSKNIVVMPNPCSFRPLESHNNRVKKIIAVGRIDHWNCKGFDLLLRVWSKIYKDYPEWDLCIYGKGSEASVKTLSKFDTVEDLHRKAHLVQFQSNIIDCYRNSSIFVLPSRSEGFPMVLVEALSQGCACLACENLNRTKDIIDSDDCGLLFQTGNVEDLEQKLRRLVEDQKLRDKLSANGIERSKQFSVERIVDKWIHELQNI